MDNSKGAQCFLNLISVYSYIIEIQNLAHVVVSCAI